MTVAAIPDAMIELLCMSLGSRPVVAQSHSTVPRPRNNGRANIHCQRSTFRASRAHAYFLTLGGDGCQVKRKDQELSEISRRRVGAMNTITIMITYVLKRQRLA